MAERVQILLADSYNEPEIQSRGFRLSVAQEWRQILARAQYGSLSDCALYAYDDESKGALGPTWLPEYPDAQNTVAAWGSPAGLRAIDNLFPSASGIGSKGLLWGDATADAAVTLTAGFTTYEINRPALIRLYRAQLPDGQTLDLWKWTLDRFVLEILNDDVYVTLGGVRTQTSLSVPKEQWVQILIRPENWGVIHIHVNKSHDVIYDRSLVKNRQQGQIVIGAGTPVIDSEGGAFAWQSGNPLVEADATASLKVYPNPGTAYNSIPNGTVTIRGEAPEGTDYTVQETAVGDGRTNLVASFESDGRFFPLIRFVELYQQGTARARISGTALAAYDSEDHLDPTTGTGLVQELDIQQEDVTRRMTCTVKLRNMDYTEAGIEKPQNRMGSLLYDGNYILRGGICNLVTPANMKKVAGAGGEPEGKGETYSQLEFVDGWLLLERQKIRVSKALDGMRLSNAINLLLADQGWTAYERGGINLGTGPVLDTAVANEDWAEVAEKDASVASVILRLMEKYGEGWGIIWDNIDGQWTFFTQPTVAGHAASAKYYFSSTAVAPGATFGGKPVYTIHDRLDLPRDNSDIFNDITVIGDADAETGEPIVATARHYGSARDPNDPAYVGQWIPLTITDTRIKTKAVATARALAELAERTQPTDFVQLITDWVDRLYINDRIWLETGSPQPYKVHRVNGSSIAAAQTTQWIARRLRS